MPTGKLSASEQRAFQSMYDTLMAGRVIRLSMRQRAWADEIYKKHDLDKERKHPAKRVTVKDRALLPSSTQHPLDQLAATRVLKPPGR